VDFNSLSSNIQPALDAFQAWLASLRQKGRRFLLAPVHEAQSIFISGSASFATDRNALDDLA
jgi:hypothetical protein